ncbi:hypothetical protein VCHA53O466_140076 [Vibrio chagasii]|nr:hypothetical protein VCHA53O466_140076 [Vibrio chagasii]
MSKSIFNDERLPNVSVEVNHDAETITFASTDTDDSNTFGTNGDYDQWGSCTIDGLIFDFHILFDEDFNIFIYPFIEEDNECDYGVCALPRLTEIGQIK